ncbi:TPA: phage tail protein [Escherichia coli]|nr:phage tail protein [Escherichia coli]
MTVSFSNIPTNLRVPLFYVEVDNSMANSATETQRTLLIGQMTAEGTATAGTAYRCSSASTAAGLCGEGSMLHTMLTAYLKNDSYGETWLLPLADDDSSMTTATGSISVDSVPTASGVIYLYIAGTRVRLTVKSTHTQSEIASLLAAKINATSALPVTASVASDGTTIELTARNSGEVGNTIDIRLNYHGSSGGESTPDGLTLTITAMSGGEGAPDLADALASLGDRSFDFIVLAYPDTTSLNDMKDFLSDDEGRWAWDKQIYGHAFTAASGSYGELADKGESRNDRHMTLWGVYDGPNTSYDYAAAMVGALAQSVRNDPARPTQTLSVSGVLAPPLASRFTLTERNTLLYSGISTFTVSDDDTVMLENTITTYQANSYGAADDSYLQIETMYTLMYVMRSMKTQVTSKMGRMKLADDGANIPAGSAIVTPSIIRAELIAQFNTLANNGYVQDADAFAEQLVVERDSDNPNRVNVVWPGRLMNQLRIFAVLNQFRLNSSSD